MRRFTAPPVMAASSRLLPLVAPLFVACSAPETGIDRTVLTGSVVIPPALVDEKDPAASPNDASPQALGDDGATALTYRAVVVSGSTGSWTPSTGGAGTADDEVYGDADLFAFSPVADGAFSVTLTFPTGAGTDTADGVVYDVYIADAATLDLQTGDGILAGGSSDGSAGVFTVEADLAAGGDYVLVIGGVANADGDVAVDYSAVLSGSAPGADTVKVGAYLEGDPAVASDPVGGTTAQDWTFDPATSTWSATYEILYLRSVVMPPEDTAASADAAVPSPEVDEALDGPIYLMAGTLTNLNGTPSAGALYSATAVEASATNTATSVDTAIVLDALFPKVIGVQATETLPDTTVALLDADYALIEDSLVAQDLGMLSGLGYVDIVDGASTLTGGDGWDANDGDAYSFTVPATTNVRLTASWPSASADIDFGIWGYYEGYGIIDWFSSFGDSYCLTGSNPESCETVVTLEPDVTYYLVALGYAGDAGDEPYHVELEWMP